MDKDSAWESVMGPIRTSVGQSVDNSVCAFTDSPTWRLAWVSIRDSVWDPGMGSIRLSIRDLAMEDIDE